METKTVITLNLLAIVLISFALTFVILPDSYSFENSLITGAAVANPSSVELPTSTEISEKDLIIIFPILIITLILLILMILIYKKSKRIAIIAKSL